MIHFTDFELQRWRESGPREDRERVVALLAECGACASQYAAFVRARPLPAEAATDVEEFVAAGYAVGEASVSPAGRRHRVRWMVTLAAAAALVAAVAVPWALLRDAGERELRFRGAGIHALSPAGAVRGDLVFSWSSAIVAPRFRLEVGNASGVVYSAETDQSRVAPPTFVQQRLLAPGLDYWWTVTALDGSGRPLQVSPRQTFSISTAR